MSSTTIYLKLPQVKEVYEPEVYLGMIADVHSSDRAAEAKAKAVKITSFSGKGKEAVFVGNVMELVEKIEKTGQNIQVDNVGESDFVVTYRAGKKKSLVWEWMKTAMVSAVAFFGAAFAFANAVGTGTFQPLSSWWEFMMAALLAVITAVLSNLTLVLAVQRIGSTLTSVLGVMEPLTAVFVGILVFNEPFTPALVGGVILISSSVTLVMLGRQVQAIARRFQRKAA